MNNMLDSPIEALAFDYVSIGLFNVVVNSIWTWLAVVTAAVSFWRLRSPKTIKESFKLKQPSSNDVDVVRNSNGSAPFPVASLPAVTEAVVGPVCTSLRGGFEDEGGLDSKTKGVKFALYCDEDVSVHVDGGGESTIAEESGCENCWWEGDLRMRKEEKSWYRCQDFRVFNGNVVRLWDS